MSVFDVDDSVGAGTFQKNAWETVSGWTSSLEKAREASGKSFDTRRANLTTFAAAGNISQGSTSQQLAHDRLNFLQDQDNALLDAQQGTIEASGAWQGLLRPGTNVTEYLTYEESGFAGTMGEYYLGLFGGDGVDPTLDSAAYLRSNAADEILGYDYDGRSQYGDPRAQFMTEDEEGNRLFDEEGFTNWWEENDPGTWEDSLAPGIAAANATGQ